MTKRIAAALLMGALFIAAPAFAQEAAAPAAEPAPAAAPAPEVAPAPAAPAADVVPGKISAPAPGKGKVVFFRESKFQGSAISYKIRTGPEGATVLGQLGSGVYFAVDADPGVFSFSAATEAKDTMTIEVEEGEVYWIEGKLQVGMWVGQPNLTPSNQATFEKYASKLKPAKPVTK
ncbi:MAG: hypothetical protein JWR84_194 [Caulobacter sp.]|nr:hypothetical protein [Caulobacter sp.]